MRTLLFICILTGYINIYAQPVYHAASSPFGGLNVSGKNDEILAAFFMGAEWKYYSFQLNIIQVTAIKNDPYNGNKFNISSTIGLNFFSALIAAIATGGMKAPADSGGGRILFFALISPVLLNSEHHLNIFQIKSDSLKLFNLSLFGGTQFDTYGLFNNNLWARFALNTGIQAYYAVTSNSSSKISLALQGGISKRWDIANGAQKHSFSPYVSIKLFSWLNGN